MKKKSSMKAIVKAQRNSCVIAVSKVMGRFVHWKLRLPYVTMDRDGNFRKQSHDIVLE